MAALPLGSDHALEGSFPGVQLGVPLSVLPSFRRVRPCHSWRVDGAFMGRHVFNPGLFNSVRVLVCSLLARHFRRGERTRS